MSELKRKLKSGSISVEDGVLDLQWSCVTLELGDDEYLKYLGVVRIINGRVYNPLGLVIPNVEYLFYKYYERIVLPEIVEKLELYRRFERNIVISQYIDCIYITSDDRQLELFDVRCDVLVLYNTLFNRYIFDVGLTWCSENFYLLKMGVCLN